MPRTPLAINETWYQRPPGVPTRISAGGVVARLAGEQVLVALTREGHWPQFVLPKGGVERGEQIEAAARREIEEEAGLCDLQLLGKLGVPERCGYKKTNWIITHFFLYATSQIEGTPTDAKRHFGVWWFPIDDLPDFMWPDQKALIVDNGALIEEQLKNCKKQVPRLP